jgi:hypothetical protein
MKPKDKIELTYVEHFQYLVCYLPDNLNLSNLSNEVISLMFLTKLDFQLNKSRRHFHHINHPLHTRIHSVTS